MFSNKTIFIPADKINSTEISYYIVIDFYVIMFENLFAYSMKRSVFI